MDDFTPQSVGYALPEYLQSRRTAMRRQWVVQVVALSVSACCLIGAGWLLGRINVIRKEKQLVIDPATVKGLPPDLALLGKLGTFRALAIDWASIRADRFKDEGKTYEAMQLHQMVCALAPRFPQVWANAAWNMAYNISVMKYSPEERWKWVQNGIKLLRDKGIQYNPKAVGLYRELAWIYWHKVGDFLDDEHLNYKRALAVEMEAVLGAQPVTVTDQDYFDWFRKVVDAPRDLAKFMESDEEVARLVFRLRDVRLAPDESLLEFVAENFRPELREADLLKDRGEQDTLFVRRMGVLKEPQAAEALERLLSAVRSKVIRDKFKMDLDYMVDLMVKQYGPLDWRNTFSHGLYWSSFGNKVTRGRAGATPADVVNTAREIFFSLQSMITRGRITLWPDFDDPFASYIELSPDTRFIPYLYDTYLRVGKEQFGSRPGFKEGTPGPNYMNGFISCMQNWIELLYLEGGTENMQRAENYYVWLRENNPHPDGSTQEQYLMTLDEYVMGGLLDQLQTYKVASAIVRQFINRSLSQLAWGDQRGSLANLKRSRLCYEFWTEDTKTDPNERRKMQPFRVIYRDEIGSFMTRPEIAPLLKARLWRELDLDPRQMTFDGLRPYFERLSDAQTPPWDVLKSFPEPPGMEAFRQVEIETRGKRREGIEEGEKPN